MHPRPLLRYLRAGALALCLPLTGCGLKGPLYLLMPPTTFPPHVTTVGAPVATTIFMPAAATVAAPAAASAEAAPAAGTHNPPTARP
jgi:predicted small lipoprotein YifL